MRVFKNSRQEHRVTLRTVASAASVALTTASMILREDGRGIELYHPDTVRRVRACAQKLGYRRNLFACAIPSSSSSFFALVLKEQSNDSTRSAQWNAQGALWQGVNAAAVQHSVHPVVAGAPHETTSESIARLKELTEGGVSAALFETPGPATEELIRARLCDHRPTVVLFPNRTSDWPTNALDVDHLAIGRTAGRLLARKNRYHWVAIRNEQTEASRLRCEGLGEIAREVGAKVVTLDLPENADEGSAAGVVLCHLQRATSAGIFVLGPLCSIATAWAYGRAQLNPEDGSPIVACDASPWQIPGGPRLTTIETPWREAGVRAVHELIRMRTAGNGSTRMKTILLRPIVVSGESCPVPARLDLRRKPSTRRTEMLSVVCA